MQCPPGFAHDGTASSNRFLSPIVQLETGPDLYDQVRSPNLSSFSEDGITCLCHRLLGIRAPHLNSVEGVSLSVRLTVSQSDLPILQVIYKMARNLTAECVVLHPGRFHNGRRQVVDARLPDLRRQEG